MKRKTVISICIVLLLTFLAGTAFGQEIPFLEQLQQRLREQEWPEQQIQEMLQAARQLNWDDTNPGNAEIVELALQLTLREQARLSGEEQAQLALQVAIAARQMQQAGLSDRDTAAACMECTREMLRELQRIRTQDTDADVADQLQQRIRNIIRNRIQNATKQQVNKRGSNAQNRPQGAAPSDDEFPPDNAGKR